MRDLVEWASEVSRRHLANLGDRWLHVQGVVRKAERIAPLFDGDDREHLIAAAHLHDVGYAPSLRQIGAHQLDGARFIRACGEERLAGLVAHHSEARFELELRGLGDDLALFAKERSAVADALTYCDLTTGPTGEPMRLKDRVAEVVTRYGVDSLVVRALRLAEARLVEAVAMTEEGLRSCGLESASGAG